MHKFILGVFLVAASVGQSAQLTIPESAQSVFQGGTIGWSYTITNDLTYDGDTPWILLTYAQWVPDGGVDYPGMFISFIGTGSKQNLVVGPDTGHGEVNPLTETYDSTVPNGAGEMTIHANAVPGTYTGRIVIEYDVFVGWSPNEPGFDSSLDFLESGEVSSPVTIQVLAASPTADVPEPRLAVLTGGLLALGLWSRRRR